MAVYDFVFQMVFHTIIGDHVDLVKGKETFA